MNKVDMALLQQVSKDYDLKEEFGGWGKATFVQVTFVTVFVKDTAW